MKFYPKPRVIVISLLFIALFLRLSYWQWERHLFKQKYIQSLEDRLKEPPQDLADIIKAGHADLDNNLHRRVRVSGSYDFEHEMALRNRRFKEQPGIHVLTPLHVAGTAASIIVDRGFVPFQYASKEDRAKLERNSPVSLVGLVKEGASQSFIPPFDPASGPGHEWVDSWLRVNLQGIGKQLPYSILPFYIEIIPGGEKTDLSQAVIETKDDKAEIFMPKDKLYGLVATRTDEPPSSFPIPQVDTVLPPARHLGYVFEWAAMALITLGLAVILQLRPPRVES